MTVRIGRSLRGSSVSPQALRQGSDVAASGNYIAGYPCRQAQMVGWQARTANSKLEIRKAKNPGKSGRRIITDSIAARCFA
jgi:hypothetical protein